jgi:hypothetical protein
MASGDGPSAGLGESAASMNQTVKKKNKKSNKIRLDDGATDGQDSEVRKALQSSERVVQCPRC